MTKTGGDDLDDDFVPDELVAMSDDEDALQVADGDINALLSADEEEMDEGEVQKSQAAAAKKRKRREKEKERKAKKLKVAESAEPLEVTSVAAQTPVLLADYLSSMQAKTFSKMSGIELTDIQIPDSEFHSRHNYVDRFQGSGSVTGLYNQSATYAAYSFSATAQIERGPDTTLYSWSSTSGG